MGEADSSENGLSENSSAKKFSFTKIAQLISGHNANDHEGAVIDVDAYENLDANLDEETRSRASDLFRTKCTEAEQLIDNPSDVLTLLDAVKNWTVRFSRKMNSDAVQSLTTVFRMVSAAVSGEYQGLSKSTIACLVGSLLYCITPIDVIPDAIPVVGLFDDAFVLSLTVKHIAEEIKTFRMWERLKAARSVLASYLPYFEDVKHVALAPGWMTANDDCSAEIKILAPVFPNAEFQRCPWNANVSWQSARDYVDGQGPEEFEEFIRDAGDLGAVALIGHSLGARLVVRTLARLTKEPQKKSFWSRKPSNRVAQAFLLGAAVDVDDPDLLLAAKGVTAPLCNFFSQSDRVLSYLYRVAEQKTPLGLVGMATPCENYVDCAVFGREEYWLDFAERAASVLTFFKSSTVLKSFSLAECMTGGLPEYYGHRFQLYARFFKESVLNDGEHGAFERSKAGDATN